MQDRTIDERANDKAPDYRIPSGSADLGGAWKTASQGANDYLSVRLEAPSFGNTVKATLVLMDGVHTLVWSRNNGRKED